ncbi:MAG: membrane protein insertase YidC [Streptosporangiaceae bacterium]|nr:membrane protein insertase YidC [Streptosporangiaceae bacterium]MBV9855828.1 membrane protein insertase YidC [Streptosporangiaceae bacterium]
MTGFLGVPVDAAYHLVFALTGILTPVLGGLAAAAGIVAFTMAVRLLIMPLSYRALRGQAAQARLAPQLVALRQRYGKQPERLQREMTALYRREGTGMFAGFLPVLAQWPFLSVMYLLFRSPHVAGGTNKLLTHALLGVPLGSRWLGGGGIVSAQGAVFLGVFTLLAALCWLSARLARRLAPARYPAPPARKRAPAPTGNRPPASAGNRAPVPAGKGSSAPAGKSVPASPPTAPAGAFGVLTKTLPYVTVLIAVFAPLAAGVYLVTSTGWSLAERRIFARFLPARPAGASGGGGTRKGQAAASGK